MQKEKIRPYAKWILYYALLLLFYTLQTTPHLFEIFSVKPVFVVPLAICVCMFEDVMPSAVFCIIAGVLWDISSDKLMGFNAIILLASGVLISLLCIYYLHTKLFNSLGFCAVVMFLQGTLNYIFYFAIWNYADSYLVLLQNILPTVGYTLVFSVPIFYLIRKISNKMNLAARL